MDELAAALERPVLRDGLDPMYEPLTLVTSSEALAELNEMGELVAASDGTLRMPAIQS